MTNEQIVNKVYEVIAPLIEKMDNMEDTDMIEFQIDAICEDLTNEQSVMLDEMF